MVRIVPTRRLRALHRAGLPPDAEVLILSVADVFLPPSSSPAPTLPADVPIVVQRAWAQATPRGGRSPRAGAARPCPARDRFPNVGRARRGVCRCPCLGGRQTGRYLAPRSHCRRITRPLRHEPPRAWERLAEDSHRGPVLGAGRTKPPPRQPRPRCAYSSGWMARLMPPPPCVQWPHACGRRE